MISRELATRLAPYVSWTPANGDMFFIPRPEIADSVFIISDMVVELVESGGESRFHFNGTVEWALDSVESDGVVWLPRERPVARDARRLLLVSGFLGWRFRGDRQRPWQGVPHCSGVGRGRRVRTRCALRSRVEHCLRSAPARIALRNPPISSSLADGTACGCLARPGQRRAIRECSTVS